MERKYYLRGLGLGIAMTAIIMGVALSGNKTMTDEEIIARAKELGMVENTVLSDSDHESDDENTDETDADSEDTEQQGMTESEQNLPVETEQDLSEQAGQDLSEQAGSDLSEQAGQDSSESAGEDVPAEADNESASNKDTEGSDKAETTASEEADRNDTTATNVKPANAEEPKETANEIITSAAVKTITVKSGDGSYTVAKKLADVGVVTSAETFDTFLCQNGYDKRLRTGTFSIPADASDEQIARIVTGAE